MIFTLCSWLIFNRLPRVKTFLYITWLHLANTFIQSKFQCIQVLHLSVCAFSGNETHDLGVAKATLDRLQEHHHFNVSEWIQSETLYERVKTSVTKAKFYQMSFRIMNKTQNSWYCMWTRFCQVYLITTQLRAHTVKNYPTTATVIIWRFMC